MIRTGPDDGSSAGETRLFPRTPLRDWIFSNPTGPMAGATVTPSVQTKQYGRVYGKRRADRDALIPTSEITSVGLYATFSASADMIIILFHVLYLLGKFVYQNYRVNRRKTSSDAMKSPEERLDVTGELYRRIDPEAEWNYDGKPTLKFFPPAYVQRYVAVSNVLADAKYEGKLRKIVDFGCSELGFLVYLKQTVGVESILCVDIDREVLQANQEKAAPLISEYLNCRTSRLTIEICEGSVTDNDRKLEKTDAVVCIELIEHLQPDVLTELPYNIFGFIRPKLVVITTPNADFNVLFPNFSGFRHHDHKFEWTREQFQDWSKNIVQRYPDYEVTFDGICKGPKGTEHLGACTQMAVFHRYNEAGIQLQGVEGLFKTVSVHEYPVRVDNRSDEQKIVDEATYQIRRLSCRYPDMQDEVPLEELQRILKSFYVSMETLRSILEGAGMAIQDREEGAFVLVPQLSTFSDYSAPDIAWDDSYSVMDDEENEDWNTEPGAPTDFSVRVPEPRTNFEPWYTDDDWGEEECSIIIPRNTSVPQNNSYSFDAENISSDLLEGAANFSTPEKNVEVCARTSTRSLNVETERSSSRVSSNESKKAADLNVSKGPNDSMLETSLNSQTVEEDMLDDSCRNAQNGAPRLDRMLDYPYASVSRSSTSPEPYLLQTVRLDRHLKDNSTCNQDTSYDHWMLNNTFKNMDISKDSVQEETDACDDLSRSNLEYGLCSIYVSALYNENKEDSDRSMERGSTNTCTNESQDVQDCTTQDRFLKNPQVDAVSLASINSCISEQPRFTSSPKVSVKTCTTSGKRKSLVYSKSNEDETTETLPQSERLEVDVKNSLESVNQKLRSNSGTSVSTTSSVAYGSLEKWYDEKNRSPAYEKDVLPLKGGNELADKSSDSLIISDTSTVTSTTKVEEKTVDPRMDGHVGEPRGSDPCDKTDNQRLQSGTPVELIYNKSERKTEPVSELQSDTSIISTSSYAMNVTTIDVEIPSGPRTVQRVVDSTANSYDAKDDARLTSSVQSTSVLKTVEEIESAQCRESKRKDADSAGTLDMVEAIELKPSSPENPETPPNSWSPEIMDSGYPNSASAQDMTPEYDLSSIAHDHISDSESPSVAEAPRLAALEVVEVENGDLANNNRDGEGNNMVAVGLNELEDWQPLLDVLEDDLENENDIYAVENGFPIWLLRILEMANPAELEVQVHRDRREMVDQEDVAGGDAGYVNADRDEGFDSSSSEEDDLENHLENDDNSDVNENAMVDNLENDNENASNSDSGSYQWAAGDT